MADEVASLSQELSKLSSQDNENDDKKYSFTKKTNKLNKLTAKLREEIIDKLIAGFSPTQISRNYGLSINVIGRIWLQYSRTGVKSVRDLPSKIVGFKLSKVCLDELDELLSKNCRITKNEMLQHLKIHHGIEISSYVLSQQLRGLKYSFARVNQEHVECTDEQIERDRRIFAEKMLKHLTSLENLVFIHEIKFSVSMRRFFGGRKPAGLSARTTTIYYSIGLAINKKTVIHYLIKHGELSFHEFVKSCCNYLKGREDQVIVMHMEKLDGPIRYLIERDGHQIETMPLASWKMCPVEQLFMAWTRSIKDHKLDDEKYLYGLASTHKLAVGPEDCSRLISKSVSEILKFLDKTHL